MCVCVVHTYIFMYIYVCVCVCMCRKDDFGVGAIAGTMEKIAADPEARDENGVVLVAMGNPSLSERPSIPFEAVMSFRASPWPTGE